MVLLGELIKASAVSIVTVILIVILGFLCAIYPRPRPLMRPDARRDVGELCLRLVWPALMIASIGPTVSPEHFAGFMTLLIWCLMECGVAGALSWCFARALELDPISKATFCLAGSFGNAAALPMMMMRALCSQPVVKKHVGDIEACINYSFANIMIHMVAWNILFFSVGVPLLKNAVKSEERRKRAQDSGNDEDQDKTDAGMERGNLWRSALWRIMTQPPILACYLGLFVSLIEPLSDALFTGTFNKKKLASISSTVSIFMPIALLCREYYEYCLS